MGFFSGVSSGIAKGSTAKIKGEQDKATQEALVKERARKEEMYGINKKSTETTNEMRDLQIKELKSKIAQQTQTQNKADAYKFVEQFNNSTGNDTSALNNLIQHNKASGPSLGKIYDEEKGQPIVRIQPLSISDNHILPNEMKDGSIDINPKRMVKGITADGREVFMDLAEYNTINGFQKQLDKDGQERMDRLYEIKKRNLEVDKLQMEVASAGDEGPISREGKAAHDFGLRAGPEGSPEYKKASAEYWAEKMYSGSEQIRSMQEPLTNTAIDRVYSEDTKLPTGKELLSTLSEAKRLDLYKDKDITKDKILGGINVTREAGKLSKEIGKLKDEELSKGLLDQGFKAVSTYFSDADFKKLPKEEKRKILNSIKFESKIGNLVAQYIKSISGTAVAEQEYQRLSNLFGTDKFKNIDTMKAALSGWTASMTTEVNLSIENSKGQNPFDYMYYRNEMDKDGETKLTMPTKDMVDKMPPEERKQFIIDFKAGRYN
jgi:hypothetical protein